VKLDLGKLRVHLRVWVPEKDSPFTKPLKFDNRIPNDLRLIKNPREMIVD